MSDRRLGPLVPSAAEELSHLILERLLDDQSPAESTDLLDRIRQLAGIVDQCVKLVAQATRSSSR